MRSFKCTARSTRLGPLLVAAALGGCAGTPPAVETACSYRVGAWRGLDAQDAGRALARRLNMAPASLAHRVVHAEVPTMPAAAIESGLAGAVDVRWRIARDGSVADAAVDGAPPALLAQAALAAVRRWRFEPGVSEFCCVVQRFEFETLAGAPAPHPNAATAASQQ